MIDSKDIINDGDKVKCNHCGYEFVIRFIICGAPFCYCSECKQVITKLEKVEW